MTFFICYNYYPLQLFSGLHAHAHGNTASHDISNEQCAGTGAVDLGPGDHPGRDLELEELGMHSGLIPGCPMCHRILPCEEKKIDMAMKKQRRKKVKMTNLCGISLHFISSACNCL